MNKIYLTLMMKATSLSIKTASFIFIAIFLISINLATLLSASFFDLLSAGLSRVTPTEWMKNSPTNKNKSLHAKNKKLNSKNTSLAKTNTKLKTKINKSSQRHINRQSKVSKVVNRISKRTAKNITINISSVFLEAVPIAGIAVIVTVTLMDVADACNDMKDLNELQIEMGTETDNQNTQKVCGLKVPTIEEIKDKIF